jgi:arabinogalactan oligomer/maltooligosaccharide transport system permease protein
MKVLRAIGQFVRNIPIKLKQAIGHIGRFFARLWAYSKELIKDIKEGDLFVRLSLIAMGAGFFRRNVPGKAILITVLQLLFIVYMIFVGVPNLSKLGTLGTVQYEQYYNPVTRQNEVNDYDHSFRILLFSLISIVIIVMFLVLYVRNIRLQRELQRKFEEGQDLPDIKQEIKALADEKFHVTLLTLPIIGISMFTIIPLIFMILVAFTNYDQNHMPPIKLFTWVGFDNFRTLFKSGTITATFGYAFRRVLSWTLIWAFFATFLTYIGGILLALIINNRFTKWPKMWRTIFVITIAVPQFVSLLLVRHFFATQGIVNTMLSNAGITDWLIQIGLVKSNLSYVPFLTDPVWSKVMLILINCWIGFPYVMLITTGVLMNIPKDLYESAEIDGANKFQTFLKITMPYMLFVTAPHLITSFIHNMNNFNVIYLLTSERVTSDQLLANANASDTDLLITWLFKLTQDYYNYKMASTIGIVIFLLSALITLFAFNLTIRADKENRFQ